MIEELRTLRAEANSIRSRDEQTLRVSEQRFERLLDILPHGIQENDLEGLSITFSNAAH